MLISINCPNICTFAKWSESAILETISQILHSAIPRAELQFQLKAENLFAKNNWTLMYSSIA